MVTILIVDDRPETLQTLETRLQNRGFVVASAMNGNEAIAACAAQDVGAVLMDMNMPEMDGCEATEFLKSQDSTRSLPIIICSAHPLPGDEARAIAAGCDGFIEKPIVLNQFLELLGKLLQQSFDLNDTAELEDIRAALASESKPAVLPATDATTTPNQTIDQ